MQSNISSLSAARLDKLAADAWLLSPPCQPYTRRGKQLHSADDRAGSFLSLLDRVREMARPPALVLVENVVGFDRSDSRDVLVESLSALGYSWLEAVASPADLGIPYSRPRYFLLASRKGPVLAPGAEWTLPFKLLALDGGGPTADPAAAAPQVPGNDTSDGSTPGTASAAAAPGTASAGQGRPLVEFLLPDPEAELRGGVLLKLPNDIRYKQHGIGGGDRRPGEPNAATPALHDSPTLGLDPRAERPSGPLALTPAVLLKHGWCLDIVTAASTRSCCFTKTYGQYIKVFQV